MSKLHLDVETRSVLDLKKVGAHVYAQHPSTALWCACFAIDDGEIHAWFPGQPCPQAIVDHVASGDPICAHNAAFERLIWKYILYPRHGWPLPLFDRWHCTMARSFAMALPGSLEDAAIATNLEFRKDDAGQRIMMRMARPRRFDDKGGAIWWEDQTRIIRLVNYCMGDVAAERALDKKLNQLRQDERQIWLLDQMINDRGVQVDQKLCMVARKLVEGALIGLDAEIVEVSGGMISNVNSVAKIVAFCRAKGVPVDSIAAPIVEQLLTRDLPPDVYRVLEIRQLASKASVKKINALLNGMSPDGRARGMLAYHAASTGRWAGRRFQPQNLKRPVDHDQNGLIKLIRTGSPRAVQMLGGPVLDVVSDVLRGLIVAADGQQLFAADYSNIEGRALAWLAGEQWKLAAFRDYDNGTGPDLYKLAYARSFHVSVDSITGDQRQIGKVLELSLGYQGGVGAFQTMAVGYRVVVSDERANELKVAWREAHPAIVRFWPAVEIAAIRAVQNPGLITTAGRLSFRTAGEHLYMRLPSGRSLCYPYAKIMPQPTPWGSMKQTLTFKTVIGPNNAGRIIEADTGSWARIGVYGGLLVENATQAVARDVMAEAMLRVEVAGYPVILTVHDEIVAERSGGDLAEFKSLMETPPSWSKGFPIVAEAWTGNRYHKN